MRLMLSFLLLSMISYAGCSNVGATPSDSPAAKPIELPYDADGKATMNIEVPKLHCEHCAATAVTLLEKLDGVTSVEADFETKMVTVKVQKGKGFEPQKAIDTLVQQFDEAKYVEDEKS